MTKLLARLNAARDLDVDLLAVDAGQNYAAAERSCGEADRAFGDERRALALVERV